MASQPYAVSHAPFAAVARLAWFGLATLALTAATPRTAPAQEPLAEGVMEIRFQRGPHQVIVTLVADTVLLVPLGEFLALAEIRQGPVLPARRFDALLEPDGGTVRFDTEHGRLTAPDTTMAIGPGDAVWRDSTLYVSAAQLAAAFGVVVDVNWSDLQIVVRGTDHLPVIRRMEREAKRAAILRARDTGPAPFRAEPDQPWADGAVLDWALSSATQDPLEASALELGVGAQLLGGSVSLRHVERRTSIGRAAFTEASWTRAWPQQEWLRQIRLGDVAGTGRELRGVRGAALTNAPFVRRSAFALEQIRGPTPPGWEVEIYQHERLVGFERPGEGGRFTFDVPVRYGQNPLEFVAYGPLGQVERFRRTVVIPFERLPARQFEYGLTLGECVGDPCQATSNVDARYGISSRVTVQAGADFFWRDSLPDLWHPYVLASGAITRTLSVTGEAVARGLVRGRVDFVPTPDLELGIEHTEFTSSVDIPLVGSAVLHRSTVANVFWRPGRRDRAPYMQIMAFRTSGDIVSRDVLRISGTARFGGGRVEVGVDRRGQRLGSASRRTSVAADARVGTLLAGPIPAFRHLFVHATARTAFDSGLTRLTGSVARQITQAARVELEASWQRGVQGFGISFGITTAFRAFRAVSQNAYSEGGGIRGTQLVEGSVLWDRNAGRVDFADGRSVGRAGLSGQVFLDENGNGRRDPGEPGYPLRHLRVGSRGVATDSLGRFSLWDVVPFEAVMVAIDPLALDNPLWVPAYPVVELAPGPHRYNVLEIPLVRAGDVSGRVHLEGRGIGGVRVRLRHLDTGSIAEATTFSDGAFFFLGLVPGDYRLELDELQAAQLGVTAQAAEFTVNPARDEVTFEGVELQLLRN